MTNKLLTIKTNKDLEEQLIYEQPLVEFAKTDVEQGFAQTSVETTEPWDPTQSEEWDD